MAIKKILVDHHFINSSIYTDAAVNISGSYDVTQLAIKGFSASQSSDIISIKDALNVDLFRIFGTTNTGSNLAATPFTVEGKLDTSKPLIVKGTAGISVDIARFQAGASILAKVDSGGRVFGTGLDATSTTITSVADGATMADAVNVDQTLRMISGTMPYWETAFEAINLGDGVTDLSFVTQGADTNPYEVPITRDCLLHKLSVNAFHNHGSDPGDWDLQLVKDEQVNPTATLLFDFNASNNVDSITVGSPVLHSGSLAFTAGQRYRLSASGVAVNGGILLRGYVGWLLNETLDFT